jgi:SAM-dependent methyltransferase
MNFRAHDAMLAKLRETVAESPTLRPFGLRILRWQEFLRQFGTDPVLAAGSLLQVPRFLRDAVVFNRRARAAAHRIPMGAYRPILSDYGKSAGTATGHYFHQDLWAARKVFLVCPKQHLDIGSRIDGFIAHLLCFTTVLVIDVRPLESGVTGLQFIRGDATSLDGWPDGSVGSLSSLHAIEHFGLGRYGDPIDPDGPFRAMASLARVLRRGGRLYFSVPIGRERVEFNAQRIFAPRTILDLFASHGLTLVEFSAIDDGGHLRVSANPRDFELAEYSCGLFEFTK